MKVYKLIKTSAVRIEYSTYTSDRVADELGVDCRVIPILPEGITEVEDGLPVLAELDDDGQEKVPVSKRDWRHTSEYYVSEDLWNTLPVERAELSLPQKEECIRAHAKGRGISFSCFDDMLCYSEHEQAIIKAISDFFDDCLTDDPEVVKILGIKGERGVNALKNSQRLLEAVQQAKKSREDVLKRYNPATVSLELAQTPFVNLKGRKVSKPVSSIIQRWESAVEFINCRLRLYDPLLNEIVQLEKTIKLQCRH